jgi:hypothetical protein
MGTRRLVEDPTLETRGTDHEIDRKDAYEGKIPAIAEKEKRGKRIKVPKNEIYVQEIRSGNSEDNSSINGGVE